MLDDVIEQFFSIIAAIGRPLSYVPERRETVTIELGRS